MHASFSSSARAIFRTSLLVVTLLIAGAISASAQVVVYKLAFKKEGRSLNFSFYEGGYFVATAPQGSGTFIFLVEEDGRRYYTSSSDGGKLFISEDGDLRMASIAGTGGASGSSSLLLASGFDPKSRSLGGGISVPVVEDLKGVFTAYGSLTGETDGGDDTDGEETPTAIENSFAGSAEVKAKLDLELTREANSELASLSRATEIVLEEVRRRGFVEESTDDGGDDEDPVVTVSDTN